MRRVLMATMAGIVGLMALVGGASVMAQDEKTPPAQQAEPKTRYAVYLSPGASFDKNKSMFEQDLAPHQKHMIKIAGEGKMIMGGPFLDESGGLYILDVATIEEANTIAQADGGVTSGVLKAEVHPWMVVVDRD